MFVLQKETGTSYPPPRYEALAGAKVEDDAERQAGSIAEIRPDDVLEEGSAELYGGIEYATDLFDRSTIERLAVISATSCRRSSPMPTRRSAPCS